MQKEEGEEEMQKKRMGKGMYERREEKRNDGYHS